MGGIAVFGDIINARLGKVWSTIIVFLSTIVDRSPRDVPLCIMQVKSSTYDISIAISGIIGGEYGGRTLHHVREYINGRIPLLAILGWSLDRRRSRA